MSESEKSDIEKEKDAFFKRAEDLGRKNVKYQVELSEEQDPYAVATGGRENLSSTRKAEVDLMLSNMFGDKLWQIAKADRMITMATMLIAEHDDNFPGIDSGSLKKFLLDEPDDESIKAYDKLRDETLGHYDVDKSDYDKYVDFITDHAFPGEDQK